MRLGHDRLYVLIRQVGVVMDALGCEDFRFLTPLRFVRNGRGWGRCVRYGRGCHPSTGLQVTAQNRKKIHRREHRERRGRREISLATRRPSSDYSALVAVADSLARPRARGVTLLRVNGFPYFKNLDSSLRFASFGMTGGRGVCSIWQGGAERRRATTRVAPTTVLPQVIVVAIAHGGGHRHDLS